MIYDLNVHRMGIPVAFSRSLRGGIIDFFPSYYLKSADVPKPVQEESEDYASARPSRKRELELDVPGQMGSGIGSTALEDKQKKLLSSLPTILNTNKKAKVNSVNAAASSSNSCQSSFIHKLD